MIYGVVLGAVAAVGVGVGAAGAATLQDVRDRGELVCGVSSGLAGFSSRDANGVWQGFDVAFCRAVAAAVLKDPMAVRLVPGDGISALRDGEVDMLARGTSWTFTHDVDDGLSLAGVTYYDGQGFMLRRDEGLASARELSGETICVPENSAAQSNLDAYFDGNGASYEAMAVQARDKALEHYQEGECTVYSDSTSTLAANRATFADPDAHVILPERISKEPRGPVVRDGDPEWEAIVRWTVFAVIAAEELGVTSANLPELSSGTQTPAINRLLGNTGGFGRKLGLDDEWARRAVAVNGNYGEIFAATIGEQTPIGLARGLNAQWADGGLIYAMPFR